MSKLNRDSEGVFNIYEQRRKEGNPINTTTKQSSSLGTFIGILLFIGLIIGVIVLVNTIIQSGREAGREYHNEIMNKPPSEWTESDEDYVRNYIEWQLKQEN